MKVLKFGGTSVGSSSAIRQTIGIIQESLNVGPVVVVVSAMSGMTNQLLAAAKLAAERNAAYQDIVEVIKQTHLKVSAELLSPIAQSGHYGKQRLLLNELEDILHGLFLIGECTSRSLDLVASYGEQLSANLIADVLSDGGTPAQATDARSLIITDDTYTKAIPDLTASYEKIRAAMEPVGLVRVITGFIAADKHGITTTLGRGGSDYTAAIIGAALDADVIEIWTDVDGMLTADPRKVEKAFTQPEVTYAEAMELSHFGAKVIYPPTILPAVAKQIPIRIANTFNPTNSGTLIHGSAQPGERPVRGLSAIDNVAVLNLYGTGLAGVAGMAAKLFAALAQAQVNVILISQASSEQAICVVIAPEDATKAERAIGLAFEREIELGLLEKPETETGLSVIAIIGEGMRMYAGVSAKVFKALGNNGVNVVASAQGSSELNISVIVKQQDLSKGLNALHDALFLNLDKTINLFLIGPGLIGKTLLQQLHDQTQFLDEHLRLRVRLVGIMNSKTMAVKGTGIGLDVWSDALADGTTADLDSFVNQVISLNLPNSVVADCTSGTKVNQYYAKLLKASVGVVTPNKTANSGSLQSYRELKQLAVRYNAPYLYETNVGAGLPIINTLQGLVQSGDPIIRIEAVLSGTLSYIFNTYGPEVSFHDAVKAAQEAGYTEPDPRDDLSGLDMARKVLILAREMGQQLEASDINIEPILPDACASAIDVEAFYASLKTHDATFAHMAAKASEAGTRLRYIATITADEAKISLQQVKPDNPFYGLNGSENMVVFTTLRYNKTPLVVKGPGAGADVTAGGVFADIMRCARD